MTNLAWATGGALNVIYVTLHRSDFLTG